jgi:hypothetical protein
VNRKVKLTKGNTKLGRCQNVSLPPCKSCDTSLPCFKSFCYGQRFYKLREGCRAAWENNWKMVVTDRVEYFVQILAAIWRGQDLKNPITLFRWHVAGDIPDMDYLREIYKTAEYTPGVKHWVFSKKFTLLANARKARWVKPDNLTIIASAWPGVKMPAIVRKNYPVAWMLDPKDPDPRIPAEAQECPGKCDVCGLCFAMKPGESVFFRRH